MEEITSSIIPQERENVYPSPTTSPHSNGSSNGSSLHHLPTPPPTPTPTPKPISRSIENNSYPTTFVQANTSTFKQVVQMLTGSSSSSSGGGGGGGGSSIPPIKSTNQKKPGFKLYERRNSLKNGLMINTLIPGYSQNSGFSPRKPEILSPSILDFPALALSPVTPLNEDSLRNSSAAAPSPLVEEARAIAEKKFYFHPSPRTTNAAEPQLLSLFPVTSPRVSTSGTSA